MRAARLLGLMMLGAAVVCAAETTGSGYHALMQKALEAFSKNDFEKARNAFADLAKTYPEDTVVLLNLGTVEFRLKNFKGAEAALASAVWLDPENDAAWLTLGMVRLEQGNDAGALAALSQAVYLNPKNSRARAYLGVVIGKKGWLLGAEKELRAALELEPGYADAHFNLALFYLQRSPPALELARRHYQRALDLGAVADELMDSQLGAAGKSQP